MSARPERVLVTGASRGIGRAVAKRLLSEGRRVCAVGRDQTALEELSGASILAADLADPKAREGLVARARASFGPIDGLVLAAGIALHRPALDVDEDALTAQWEVNALASFTLARSAAEAMIRDNVPGSIVAIASTLGRRGAAGTVGYAMSKAALLAGMRGLALELGSSRIRVNSALPGVVDTDMVRERISDPEARDRLSSLHVLGRLGTPEEVASTVLHALDHPWMSGAELVIDGGLLVRE